MPILSEILDRKAVLASLFLLVNNIVTREEWEKMDDETRCKRYEQAGYRWDGKFWKRGDDITC